MYCSESCRDKARDAYHLTECKMIALYDRNTTEDYKELVAVQAFLVGTEQGKQLPTLMAKLKACDIFGQYDNLPDKPFADKYLAALRMCEITEDELVEENLHGVVKAILALRGMSFFPETENRAVSVSYMISNLYLFHEAENIRYIR